MKMTKRCFRRGSAGRTVLAGPTSVAAAAIAAYLSAAMVAAAKDSVVKTDV
jgi:hypothetical protein